MIDRPLASDLSQLVLERRYRRNELTPPALDSSNRRLHNLPSQLVEREAFISDRESVPDSWQGEAFIPTWHFHGRKGKR